MSGREHDGPAPRLLDAGDGAMVVEFGAAIDEASSARVVALDAALSRAAIAGVIETVPTYRSLLVLFDPLRVSRADLTGAIAALEWEVGARAGGPLWHVPVLYGGAGGQDLEAVAALHDLTPDEFVAIHSGAEYRVYMIGFAPGFAYLGGLPERIHTGRRTDPRPKTPPRSIAIGGRQAAVFPPLEIPSGWHLLGQTPVMSYDPTRRERPFLFESGDRIRFEPIAAADYERLLAAARNGAIVARREAP